MPYFIDYKEEVKRLIQENYEPADLISQEFKLTTTMICTFLEVILPQGSFDEYMVYEALLELKFEPKEEKPLQYSWFFKRKDL